MNQVKVLFFATLRDYAGVKTLNMELPIGMTVAGLKTLLVEKYPKLSPARDSIMTSVNREYAGDDMLVPLNAEIALFPPVSGG
jgi:molybdopterin converting factor subunit 1